MSGSHRLTLPSEARLLLVRSHVLRWLSRERDCEFARSSDLPDDHFLRSAAFEWTCAQEQSTRELRRAGMLGGGQADASRLCAVCIRAVRTSFRARWNFTPPGNTTAVLMASASRQAVVRFACRGTPLSNLGMARLNITLSKCRAPHCPRACRDATRFRAGGLTVENRRQIIRLILTGWGERM